MIQSPIYFSVSVDIYRPAPQPIVNAQQGDSGRGLSITLWADGNLLNPTTEVITLYAQKPDGTVSYLPCTVSDGNILCAFTNQMLAIPGDVRIQLQVALSGSVITSTVCIVNVLEGIVDSGAIESTNEFTALEQLLTEIEELKKNGLKGDPGEAATIKVGKVEASPSGSAPSVTNSGTPQNAVFDFVLPRGEQGEQGEPGKQDLFFGARSTFPQTGDASILYIDNTVTPAVQYIWNGSAYVLAGGGGGDVIAESVSYDNVSSGLAANTVQGAIDENAADIKAINSKIAKKSYKITSVEGVFVPSEHMDVLEIDGVFTVNIGGAITCPKSANTKLFSIPRTFNKVHRATMYTIYGSVEFTIQKNGECFAYSFAADLKGASYICTITFID